MFNLDQAIADWCRQLAAAGITAVEVLDELESHLRDEIERQLTAGTEPQRAFEIAAQQLGRVELLKTEFAKIHEPPPARGFTRAAHTAAAAILLAIGVAGFWQFEINAAERVCGLVLLSLIALYIAGLPQSLHRLAGAHRRHAQKAVALSIRLGTPLLLLMLVFAQQLAHVRFGVTVGTAFWGLYLALVFTEMSGNFPERFLPDSSGDLNAFAPAAKQSLAFAREEALGFCHDFIGTEHVLLGLLRPGGGGAAEILRQLGVEAATVRDRVEEIIGPGPRLIAGPSLRYTPRARKAFRLATREARASRRAEVDTEYVLLGLLLEDDGIARRVLNELGVGPEVVRAEIQKRTGL